MDNPVPQKYAIEKKPYGLKIWIEGGEGELNQALEEAKQFGYLDKTTLERNCFVLEVRPTFNEKEVIEFLQAKFEEIL